MEASLCKITSARLSGTPAASKLESNRVKFSRSLAETFSAVRYYGDVVTLLAPGPEIDWNVPRGRNQRVSFELMLVPVFFGLSEAMTHQGEILHRGAELFEAGELRVHLDKTFPLERAAEAHALVASGKTKGKVVLNVD